jgi:hypothetical protein
MQMANKQSEYEIEFLEDVAVSRKRRRHMPTPVTVQPVRRSTRSKRYQGFKSQGVSDTPKRKSHVKPRRTPSAIAASSSMQVLEASSSVQTRSEFAAPPETPVAVIRDIGTRLCGIPPEELSPQKLLASQHEGDDEASTEDQI